MTQQESFIEKHITLILVIAMSTPFVVVTGYGIWSMQLSNHVVHTAVLDKVSDRSGTYCVFEASGHRYSSYNMCLFSVGEEGTFQQYNSGNWKAINP